MIEGAGDLAAVLAGGLLGGRSVEGGEGHWLDPSVLVVEIAPDERATAWREARALVDRTGRWPIVVWGGGIGGLPEPQEICARAARLDAKTVIDAQVASGDVHAGFVETELNRTFHHCGAAPGSDDVMAALDVEPSALELDRWLCDWEERAGLTPLVDDWYLNMADFPESLILAFLPTANSWESLAYVAFFESGDGDRAERLIATLRSWHDRFGAEVMYHYGTMLYFNVERPPDNLDDAWDLAAEQNATFSCTLPLPDVSVRHHAGVLIGRRNWFVHDRP